MGVIKMSTKELERVAIINQTMRKELAQAEAGEHLNLSTRQIKRLVKRMREKGAEGLCHRSRWQKNGKGVSAEIKRKVVGLYREKYGDFGPTFFSEKLVKEGIELSRETVRQILMSHGLWSVRRRRKKRVHVWGERHACEGSLVQIDGSHHRWLEDRLDQEFCFMGYIDDATSKIYGRFYEYEGVYPIFDSMERYIKLNGFPLGVYIDRHATYKALRKRKVSEDLDDADPLSQFETAMKGCQIEVIHAQSPQAKGRVERLFKTLQDRLVKEMRLAGICSIEGANVFLETYLADHNRQFSVEAKEKCPVFRPLVDAFDFHWTFVNRHTRQVQNDYTIRFKNQIFLIQKPSITLKKQEVEIREAMNGELRFTSKEKQLAVVEVFQAPKVQSIQSMSESKRKLREVLQAMEGVKSKKSWMDDFHFQKKKEYTYA